MLASVKEEFGDTVYFISLAVEEDDDREAVSEFMKGAGAESLNVGRASTSERSRLSAMAGVDERAVPTSILINAEGEIAGGHNGVPTREQMVADAKRLSP